MRLVNIKNVRYYAFIIKEIEYQQSRQKLPG